jgi:chromate transporter
MHEFLVEKKKWISHSRFLHALNYCMILPGPEAQQLATYIGLLLHGTLGGITAGVLFFLPSLFMLLGLSAAYVLYGKVAAVAAVFYGLKPAVVAIVILALIKIGKKSLITFFHFAIAILSFVLIFFFNISFPLIILLAITLGFIAKKFFPSVLEESRRNKINDTAESGYFLNAHSPPVTEGADVKSIVLKIFTIAILWTLPFIGYSLFSVDTHFWHQLSFFFTKAAFVTFGGAYAVLPYVAQESVEKYHWLSRNEMIDGLALGETTPGPLIMVLVFVGFMAGYQQAGMLSGIWGLFLTTYFTFLPCFGFILIGAPLIERTKKNMGIKVILSIITAAVVGVILNLTIYFGKSVLVLNHTPDWFSIFWLIGSIIAMYHFKVTMIRWIVVSGVVGLIHQVFL